jgi:predicted transcriptional regulator
MAQQQPSLLREAMALRAQGYTINQIALQLKRGRETVRDYIREDKYRADKRRLDDIQEMVEQILVIVRQLSKLPDTEIRRRVQALEIEREHATESKSSLTPGL